MSDYTIEIFGQFNAMEIQSIVDKNDRYWFTQETVAKALDVDRTALHHVRQNHPSELIEGDDYTSLVIDDRRQIVYSEEGFLTICDLSTSEISYRLRRWMRKQFRVRQEGKLLSVHHQQLIRSLPTEDLSDLQPDTRALKMLVDNIITHERQIKQIQQQQTVLQTTQKDLEGKVEQIRGTLQAWEEGAKLQPGEMTALQLAQHCRWTSSGGGAHNLAVILVAINEKFDEKGWMATRREEGPGGNVVEVQVFTADGIREFMNEVDSKYHSGEGFAIEPNARAKSLGYKNKRYVAKL